MRSLLLVLMLSGCVAARQDPCAPLWGTAIASSTLAATGTMLARAEVDDGVRDGAQVGTVILASGTVVAVGEAARCESKRR